MYGTKLCLGLNEQFGIDDLQQIRLLREIGFEAFFSGWHLSIHPRALCKDGGYVGADR